MKNRHDKLVFNDHHEYEPATQVPQMSDDNPTIRPLERTRHDLTQPFERLPTPLRQRKEAALFAEDVVLSAPAQEGVMQRLGQDNSEAKKKDYLKRWEGEKLGGLDVDRTYKLKRGEFSPHFGGDRARGSRSPSVSRQASRSRASIAPADELAHGRSTDEDAASERFDQESANDKARSLSRGPSVAGLPSHTRQSWRNFPEKADMALLGRNPAMNVNSSKFRFDGLEQDLGASGLSSGLNSAGASLSLSAAHPRSESALSGTESVGATIDDRDVSSSASTAHVTPLLQTRSLAKSASEKPASFVRRHASGDSWATRTATPPSKNRTPVASPQLGTRSIARRGGGSPLAGRHTRSESGPMQDFWN